MELRTVSFQPFPAKLLTECANLAQIFREAPIGLSVFDRELRYVHVNEHMHTISVLNSTGWRVRGKPCAAENYAPSLPP
jgi:hypothetical protein